ncbi:MAG TPA: hypothetical protein VJ396_01100 [Acidiferrobacterales bacterium]|nr:hypothetical protein [Acidiferrobacterales bacterium]
MYVVYEIATGREVSRTDSPALIASPMPAGLASKQVADPAAGWVWSPGLLDFVAPPAVRRIGKTEFIQRFTLAERKELFGYAHGTTYTAAQQKNLASFMRYLDYLDVIDLDDTGIQQGVNYMETVAILAAGRAAQVLA